LYNAVRLSVVRRYVLFTGKLINCGRRNTNGVYDLSKAVKNGKYSSEILSVGSVKNTVPRICYSKRLERILSLKKADLRDGSFTLERVTIINGMNTYI
jgi:hypothetical protein